MATTKKDVAFNKNGCSYTIWVAWKYHRGRCQPAYACSGRLVKGQTLPSQQMSLTNERPVVVLEIVRQFVSECLPVGALGNRTPSKDSYSIRREFLRALSENAPDFLGYLVNKACRWHDDVIESYYRSSLRRNSHMKVTAICIYTWICRYALDHSMN